MGSYRLLRLFFFAIFFLPACAITQTTPIPVTHIDQKTQLFLEPLPDGRFALDTEGATQASSLHILPLRVELQDAVNGLKPFQQGYDRYHVAANGSLHGEGELQAGGVRFQFVDEWSVTDGGLTLSRKVTVLGNGHGGFMSSLVVNTAKPWRRQDVKIFIPGMVYGGTDHIPAQALGGADVYRYGHGIVRIREDRMPAPMFGVYFHDRSSVTLYDLNPKGGSTLQDSKDFWEWNDVQAMVDARFQFGSLGEDESGGWNLGLTEEQESALRQKAAHEPPMVGYWMPGTEGEMTYGSNTHGVWRRRFHPLEDGLTQQYKLELAIGANEAFPDYMQDAWRRGWRMLNPKADAIDIGEARQSILSMLESVAVHGKGATGLPFYMDAARGDLIPDARLALMGFLGRNLQAADMMLYEAESRSSGQKELRQLALDILDSFAKLSMAPPQAGGIWFDSGRLVDGDIFLRSPSEDLYYMLSAWQREKKAGRDHPDWLRRPAEFGDWLIAQQEKDGGFPRAWKRNSTEVVAPSTLGSYNPIPLLVELYDVTHERKYLDAAIKAGDLCWQQGQSEGVFVGGTEDNPNVVDKEAGTLSLNAYLKLYEVTRENKWLQRAQAAGNYSETWIYLWNVEMPDDASNSELPWKKNVPTVGLQLIASGHSGADEYMAGEVANYARLFQYTGDRHYLDVARILLRNTKSMMGLPGRTYDLVGPGWQQEAFDLSIPRNFMQHRVWLPWISVAQLSGILATEEFDAGLFQRLSKGD